MNVMWNNYIKLINILITSNNNLFVVRIHEIYLHYTLADHCHHAVQ